MSALRCGAFHKHFINYANTSKHKRIANAIQFCPLTPWGGVRPFRAARALRLRLPLGPALPASLLYRTVSVIQLT